MHFDNISSILCLVSMIYWLYLLDPFKGKPQARRYKRIINDKTTRRVNLSLSLVLLTISLIRFFVYNKVDIGTLLPITFIIAVIALNVISQRIASRDFHLLIRGDILKSSTFDKIASFLALVIPVLISFLLPLVFGN